ncbi:hypothetical protein L1049_010764 [Liquidambar formosana]|uniref:Growth-regulating factor n=1 Tax=Liquidambar formosana TaxID=63359 RepID=A0AAP0N3D3_LIQFO
MLAHATMEAQPLQTVPPADSGRGGAGPKKSWDRAWAMMVDGKGVPVKEGSPSIMLGLGIGAGSGQNHAIKHGKPVFTPVQLKELEQQALIFKYVAAGLPVPPHLVLSIWKSVATSFGSANGGIYKQYPSFVGFNPQGFDYRKMMDPEPGRCRRTDGKKWRCSKDVVLDQKYCERHIHRGRRRSRKHVEASEIASPSDKAPPVNNKNSESSNTNQSISVPTYLQLRTPSSNTIKTGNNISTTISTSGNNDGNNNVGDNKNFPSTTATTTTTTTTTTIAITTTTATINNNKNGDNVDDEDNDTNLVNDYSSVNRSNNIGNNNNVGSSVSPGFHFSPKSVLQVLGCSSSCVDYRTYTDPEPGRCRRTDGKKWRCRRDVVPDQKYCGRHMHRGAKRQAGASQPVVVPNRSCPPARINKANDSRSMNTNLSISIPENSQVMTNDEKSTTSSSSDTISTTSTANEYSNVSHTLARSP